MSLPKLVAPKFKIELSDGAIVEYRPFTVKEEKVLLMATESGEQETMIQAIRDTIDACTNVPLGSKYLSFFDIELLFLNIRAKSVSEEVVYTYKHKNGKNREGADCTASTDVSIDLTKVAVEHNPHHPGTKFMIDDVNGVQLKYPTLMDIEDLASKRIDEMTLMARCIASTYTSDEVFVPDTDADSLRFIEEMNMKQYEKFSSFFETMPTLRHSVTYYCDGCGQEDTVTFEGVSDFF